MNGQDYDKSPAPACHRTCMVHGASYGGGAADGNKWRRRRRRDDRFASRSGAWTKPVPRRLTTDQQGFRPGEAHDRTTETPLERRFMSVPARATASTTRGHRLHLRALPSEALLAIRGPTMHCTSQEQRQRERRTQDYGARQQAPPTSPPPPFPRFAAGAPRHTTKNDLAHPRSLSSKPCEALPTSPWLCHCSSCART